MKSKILVGNIIEEGRVGGPQRRIMEIARYMKEYFSGERFDPSRENYIETIVVFPKSDSLKFQELLQRNKIKNYPIFLNRLSFETKALVRYGFGFFFEILILMKLFKREKFDVLHVSGGAWQFKGAIAAKLSGIKVLWHLNDSGMPGIIKWIFKKLSPFLADGIIVSGNRVKMFYELDYFKKPIFLVRPPVDTNYFKDSEVEIESGMDNPGKLNIVTIGNINSFKGLEFFIEAAGYLNSKYKNLVFYIIGNRFASQQAYIEMLRQQIKSLGIKNIHIRDPHSDIRRNYKSADIFVCTSTSEAGPMTVWEAMSMEKAVVSTDVGDVSAVMSNGKSGYIVPTKDSRKIAEKIACLIDNDSVRSELGRSARLAAIEKVDTKICAKSQIDAYTRIVDRSKLIN